MLEPGLVTVSCAEWVTGFLNFILDTFHMNVGILFTTKQATNHSHQNKSFHSIKNPAIMCHVCEALDNADVTLMQLNSNSIVRFYDKLL